MSERQSAQRGTRLQEVDAIVREWQQGDVLDGRRFMHAATASLPGTEVALALATERSLAEGTVAVVSEVEAVVIISHTCDMASKTHVEAPYLVVAPICRLEGDELQLATRQYIPKYAAVTWYGDDAFGDFHRAMTIERPLAVEWGRTHCCSDDGAQRTFARQLERYFGRFAFPDDLAYATKRLRDRIRDKVGSTGHEGQLLDLVHDVRVTAVPDWNSSGIEVTFLFALQAGALGRTDSPIAPGLAEWLEADPPIAEIAKRACEAGPASADYPHLWAALGDRWIGYCRAHGVIASFDVRIEPLDEITAETYLLSDPYDVDYLSGRPD